MDWKLELVAIPVLGGAAAATSRLSGRRGRLSVVTALAGEVMLFGSLLLAAWGAVVAIAFHLFVVGYEEPSLRRRFGTDYDAYCSAVPRWLPRRPAA